MTEQEKKIIDMAEARRRQQTLNKKKLQGASSRKIPSSGVPEQKSLKWWLGATLQLAFFLFLVYWLMRSCGL